MDSNFAPIFGTVVAYSSQWNSGNRAASNLIDGRPENQSAVGLGDYTSYATDGLVDQWVIIDLGAEHEISGFALWGSAGIESICVKDYRVALDNDLNGSFANVVIDSQIGFATFYFAGRLAVQRDYQPVSLQSARYVKLFLDTNHGHSTSIETMELEIIGPEIQQDSVFVNSNAEIYFGVPSIDITSDAYIVPAAIVTETVTVVSDAKIDTAVLSDALIAVEVYSDANIAGTAINTVQSDARIYRSGIVSTKSIFTMGKGDFGGLQSSLSTFILCEYFSTSAEVIVKDMITSPIMDMTNITPPLGYQNYAWKYDWVVRIYDAAQYKFEVRSGPTKMDLLTSPFSIVPLGQIIPAGEVLRYHQWRCHVWASGSGDFELHQFSIKGYIDHPANPLYSSLNSGEFTTVSKVEPGVDKPYEPMDMDRIWQGAYLPGDVNADNLITTDDIFYMVDYMFNAGPAPDPVRRMDVNDSGVGDMSDLLYLMYYINDGGPPPYRLGGFE